MNPAEVVWESKTLKVTLSDDSKKINEVVVTALGIKREYKSLGYAIQDVKGDALLNSHENNVANALTGKIAGVQITRSSNASADMDNGFSDITPEDIESMSVLKWASAATLYGSRAGNGVILITTKQNKQTNGLGITIFLLICECLLWKGSACLEFFDYLCSRI